MSQDQTGIPDYILNQYKENFAEHFKEKCIFRALSLANINEDKEPPYKEDINVFAGECNNRDRMNRGFCFAKKENNRICQQLIEEARRTSDINFELNIDYGKILVLFGPHLLEDLKMLEDISYYIEKEIRESPSNKLFTRLGKLSIKHHHILILETIDGLNFPDNGVLIFRSNNQYDFRQLNINYNNLILKHNIERNEKTGEIENTIIFPKVDKLDNIEYSYYELSSVKDLKILNT